MALHTAARILAGLARRTWLVALTTVIACAAFAANAVAALMEARYLDESGATPTAPLPLPLPAPVAVPRSTPDGAALVARNMFCSTCTGQASASSASSAVYVPDALLIATSMSDEPYATVRVQATGAQGSWGIGDAIPGIGTITRIGFVSVDVADERGRTGTLSLLASRDGDGGRSEAGAATPAPAAADPWDGRIRKIDDVTFEVERALVRELVRASPTTTGVRISPVTKHGKLDGLRLSGVPARSLAAAVGIANGDVLQAINGRPIEDANTLLELYAQLDTLASVELTGTRRGKPLVLTFRLR